MKIALLAAAVLASTSAFADDSHPYVTYGGRGVTSNAQAAKPLGPDTVDAPPAAAGQAGVVAATAQTGAFGSNNVTAGILTAAGVDPTSLPSGSQGVRGGRRGLIGGSSRSRGVATTGGSGGSTGNQAPPPYYDKPGALIRTAGQQPKYADPHDATTHAVDGGGFVTINDAKAHDVGRGPGITYGPPDKLPGANPNSGSGSGAGGNAVTSNSKGGSGSSDSSGGSSKGDSNGDGHSGDGHGNAKDSSAPIDLSF